MVINIPRLLTSYVALVSIFYIQTEGFERYYDWTYCIFKTIPCSFLSLAVYMEYSPLTGKTATQYAMGLLLGAIGDFVIALHDEAITAGAIAFAFGHLLYMAEFVPKVKQLSKELTIIILLYGAVVNHFFLMPSLYIKPISTLILVIYSLILCTALVLSGSIYFYGTKDNSPKQTNDLLRFIGYGLFFLSDSLLLLCYIGHAVPYHHFAILSTYYSSQYLILTGATNQLV